jgi:hypothetical protein
VCSLGTDSPARHTLASTSLPSAQRPCLNYLNPSFARDLVIAYVTSYLDDLGELSSYVPLRHGRERTFAHAQ